MSLSVLRRQFRDARRHLEPERRRTAALGVAARVTALPAWRDARNVAVYQPFDGELDPSAITAAARAAGMHTYLPVLADDRLRFAAFDDRTTWAPNRYGIDEPVGGEPTDATTMDLVIVPAVAVDPSGNRLGMGAGWYNRTFTRRVDAEPVDPAWLVAIVFDEQVVPSLDAQAWDVAMDAIVTPTTTYELRRP